MTKSQRQKKSSIVHGKIQKRESREPLSRSSIFFLFFFCTTKLSKRSTQPTRGSKKSGFWPDTLCVSGFFVDEGGDVMGRSGGLMVKGGRPPPFSSSPSGTLSLPENVRGVDLVRLCRFRHFSVSRIVRVSWHASDCCTTTMMSTLDLSSNWRNVGTCDCN
ncbi:hypothetical protein VTO42DRAFT_6317 [Malbranchea cinnamomea]